MSSPSLTDKTCIFFNLKSVYIYRMNQKTSPIFGGETGNRKRRRFHTEKHGCRQTHGGAEGAMCTQLSYLSIAIWCVQSVVIRQGDFAEVAWTGIHGINLQICMQLMVRQEEDVFEPGNCMQRDSQTAMCCSIKCFHKFIDNWEKQDCLLLVMLIQGDASTGSRTPFQAGYVLSVVHVENRCWSQFPNICSFHQWNSVNSSGCLQHKQFACLGSSKPTLHKTCKGLYNVLLLKC